MEAHQQSSLFLSLLQWDGPILVSMLTQHRYKWLSRSLIHRLINEYYSTSTITEAENRSVNKTAFHSSTEHPSFHFHFLSLPFAPIHTRKKLKAIRMDLWYNKYVLTCLWGDIILICHIHIRTLLLFVAGEGEQDKWGTMTSTCEDTPKQKSCVQLFLWTFLKAIKKVKWRK